MINLFCGSGGGTKGAFQGGVLEGLTERGVLFSGFAGTSTGSIQAGYMALGDGTLEGQAKQIAELKEIWFGLRKDRDIKRGKVPGAILRIILRKPSVFTLEPFERLLGEHIGDSAEVNLPLRIAAVDLATGELQRLSPTRGRELRDAILGSSSIPVATPPVGPQGNVDGGVREIAPLQMAFDLAKEFSEQPVAVYLVVATTLAQRETELPDVSDWRNQPIWKVAGRALQIRDREVITNDIETAKRTNALIRFFDERGLGRPRWLRGKRYAEVVRLDPEPEFVDFGTLEVDPDKIRRAWRHGYDRAMVAELVKPYTSVEERFTTISVPRPVR